MSRLTKWNGEKWVENHDNDTRKWKNGHRDCMNKLAELENAEDEGRLIVLPCNIGDRAYMIIDRWTKNPGCCACSNYFGGGNCDYWINEECTNIQGMYGGNTIVSMRFRYEHIPMYGKTVFLTREQAEKALKERQETNENKQT